MPSLHWIGKEKVINHHLEVPYRVLQHEYGFSSREGKSDQPLHSGNLIINGDNLEVLKSLLPKYEGKVNCIYIDPPYNTGNESWTYNDNVNSAQIKKWLGKVVGKESEDLTRHDKWLCMMYPRLKLLHKLLAKDGAIFISIDENEDAHLKLVMDEIFGARNFIKNIAVINNLKGRSDDNFIATAHESLLIYQKGNFVTNGVLVPDEYKGAYKLKDDKGYYRIQGLRKRGSSALKEDRPNMHYPFYYNLASQKLSLTRENKEDIAILPKLANGADGRWRWGKDTASNRLSELVVQYIKVRNEYDVFQKDYLGNDGEKRIKPKSFWLGPEFSSEAGTLQLKNIFKEKVFQTPKSVDLINYCLQQIANKNAIILDSFAGSGTTAHAVLNLNQQDGGERKFILVETESYAETVTAERVKRAINGNVEEKGTGGSFDYFSLGAPLFDTEDKLNVVINEEVIREYIWYSETRMPYFNPMPSSTFLGSFNNTCYYFIYEGDQLTTLDYQALADHVKHKGERYIIYADNCLLSDAFMRAKNIEFKKNPRDITRF